MASRARGLAGAAAQFAKFGVVGVSNTAISYAVYAGMVLAGCHYLTAGVVSFVVGIAWSFFWNNRFVFAVGEGEARNLVSAFARVFASYALTGLVLANLLLFAEVGMLGMNAYVAPVLNLVVTVPLNFLLHKKWALR